MKKKHRQTIPEIEISGELYCPHCGSRLFSWDGGVMTKCPHVVFAYAWNEVNFFLAVRTDFAKSFIKELLKSPTYQERLVADEGEPLTKQDQKAFCKGDFSPQDAIARVVAEHCWDFPEKMFPSVLAESTAIFKDDRLYSGVHIAVDLGT